MPRIKNMSINMAIEIAKKYANDMWLFGSVDKECVSRVCKLLLEENKKLQSRIKTTCDYLEIHIQHVSSFNCADMAVVQDMLTGEDKDDLLKILKGE